MVLPAVVGGAAGLGWGCAGPARLPAEDPQPEPGAAAGLKQHFVYRPLPVLATPTPTAPLFLPASPRVPAEGVLGTRGSPRPTPHPGSAREDAITAGWAGLGWADAAPARPCPPEGLLWGPLGARRRALPASPAVMRRGLQLQATLALGHHAVLPVSAPVPGVLTEGVTCKVLSAVEMTSQKRTAGGRAEVPSPVCTVPPRAQARGVLPPIPQPPTTGV